MTPLIFGLRDSKNAMPTELVGGKFSRQKIMLAQGLPIPKFFCISTEFYRLVSYRLTGEIETILAATAFVSEAKIAELQIKAASLKIRTLFQNLKIDPSFEIAIHTEFDRQFPPDTLVAIRSSILGKTLAESEDSAENPFAGISESFLYIRRDQILEKLRLCWASGFSPEALLYRHKQGLSPTQCAVAVGIQQMVSGQRSFVLFTCNPRTALRETVVVAGYGVGEGVVQERVGVDHFFVNQMTSLIRTELGTKSEKLELNPSTGSGVIQSPVSPELAQKPCLSDTQLRQLVAIGAQIESIFQAPQDIEGTFTEDGTLYILQSRPIALDYRRTRVWTNANVTESFPGITTPLTYSFSRFFYRVIFYDCYRRLGISRAQLHDRGESLDRMIGFLSGRVYYCLTSFYQLHMQSPLFPLFRTHWEKMMGFLSSVEIQKPGFMGQLGKTLRATSRFSFACIMITYRFLTHEREIRRFHHWWEELIQSRKCQIFEGQDPLLLETDFLEVWRQVGNHWGITLLNDTYLPVIYGWTETLFQKSGLTQPALLCNLLCDLHCDRLCGDQSSSKMQSVEIILSAVRLAEQIRAQAELKTLFESNTPAVIWTHLSEGQGKSLYGEFNGALQLHLHQFGDRGFQELKMEQPNFRSNPAALIQILQTYARQDMTVKSFQAQERELRKGAESQLKKALKGKPLQKLLLSFLLAQLRTLIRNRENLRYCRSELFGYSKRIFTALGNYFEKEKILSSWTDVFFLTQDEIFGYLDGTGVTNRLKGLADLRRLEFEEHAQAETSVQITTLGPVRNTSYLQELATPLNEGDLKGLGSSTGKVKGRAHLVLDPNQPVDLGQDGILIARETDPGWLFLMLSSKGIIVERGSMLSHTAITGRKFGIPTVVALPGATSLIPDGAYIEMDGASGIVKILEYPKNWQSQRFPAPLKSPKRPTNNEHRAPHAPLPLAQP